MAPRKKTAEGSKKLRIGWFTFTCCEGCATVFMELMNDRFDEWRKQLDFKHLHILKSKNILKDLDVAVVEGAISTHADCDKLKQIRENCKYLMVVGSCAITGMPAGLRNNFNSEQAAEIKPMLEKFGHLPRVEPISKFVKVDARVPGCPMSDKLFLEALDTYLKEFGVK